MNDHPINFRFYRLVFPYRDQEVLGDLHQIGNIYGRSVVDFGASECRLLMGTPGNIRPHILLMHFFPPGVTVSDLSSFVSRYYPGSCSIEPLLTSEDYRKACDEMRANIPSDLHPGLMYDYR